MSEYVCRVCGLVSERISECVLGVRVSECMIALFEHYSFQMCIDLKYDVSHYPYTLLYLNYLSNKYNHISCQLYAQTRPIKVG